MEGGTIQILNCSNKNSFEHLLFGKFYRLSMIYFYCNVCVALQLWKLQIFWPTAYIFHFNSELFCMTVGLGCFTWFFCMVPNVCVNYPNLAFNLMVALNSISVTLGDQIWLMLPWQPTCRFHVSMANRIANFSYCSLALFPGSCVGQREYPLCAVGKECIVLKTEQLQDIYDGVYVAAYRLWNGSMLWDGPILCLNASSDK